VLGLEAEHHALFRTGVEPLAVERERGGDASRRRAPQLPAIAQTDRVHPALGLRLCGDVEPVFVEERAGTDASVEVRPPQDLATRAIDEHEVSSAVPTAITVSPSAGLPARRVPSSRPQRPGSGQVSRAPASCLVASRRTSPIPAYWARFQGGAQPSRSR